MPIAAVIPLHEPLFPFHVYLFCSLLVFKKKAVSFYVVIKTNAQMRMTMGNFIILLNDCMHMTCSVSTWQFGTRLLSIIP